MDEEQPPEQSPSGAPIYRHAPRETPWTPADMSGHCLDAISDHIEEHIGPIATVWHEIMSDLVHVDVHVVAPTPERPFQTLVTSGMSDLPMTVPEELGDWAFAELMLCLPPEWKLSKADFEDERHYWPLRLLKTLARFPHEYKTWLSFGHTIQNGDPPLPYHESVGFDSMVLLRPVTVSTEFWTLPIDEKKLIQFFSVVPLYPREMELKLSKGAAELEKRFERHKISEIVNPKRVDVSRKSWWPFG